MDSVTACLAPSYDLVSTLPYLNNRQLALNLAKLKDFYKIDKSSLRYFSKRIDIDERFVLNIANEAVARFHAAWADSENIPINSMLKNSIDKHLLLLSFL